VSVALVILHAKRMRHIVFSFVVLSRRIKFFHIIIKTARFSEKITEHKICVLISSTTFA